jgi:hypothetical protein
LRKRKNSFVISQGCDGGLSGGATAGTGVTEEGLGSTAGKRGTWGGIEMAWVTTDTGAAMGRPRRRAGTGVGWSTGKTDGTTNRWGGVETLENRFMQKVSEKDKAGIGRGPHAFCTAGGAGAIGGLAIAGDTAATESAGVGLANVGGTGTGEGAAVDSLEGEEVAVGAAHSHGMGTGDTIDATDSPRGGRDDSIRGTTGSHRAGTGSMDSDKVDAAMDTVGSLRTRTGDAVLGTAGLLGTRRGDVGLGTINSLGTGRGDAVLGTADSLGTRMGDTALGTTDSLGTGRGDVVLGTADSLGTGRGDVVLGTTGLLGTGWGDAALGTTGLPGTSMGDSALGIVDSTDKIGDAPDTTGNGKVGSLTVDLVHKPAGWASGGDEAERVGDAQPGRQDSEAFSWGGGRR